MLTFLQSLLGFTAPRARSPARKTSVTTSQRPYVAAKPIYGADRIAVVGFNDRGFVISNLTGTHAAELQRDIAGMHRRVRGMHTNIADGLRAAVGILTNARPGLLRRIWLLSDGRPNPDGADVRREIGEVVQRARDAHININTIGFGEAARYDIGLLRNIARHTHNGKYVAVATPQRLAAALRRTGQPLIKVRRHAEATVYVIDCSGSMVLESMQGRPKIDVVKSTLTQLLYHKQQLFG